eukprot:jgi/Pico_ML_1/52385/g3096.t1
MSETNFAKDLVAGTAAGVSQIVVGHPFDTIKVKMQSGGAASGGAMDALRHTVRTEELIKCRLQAQNQGNAHPVHGKANLADGAFKGTVPSRSFTASAAASAETVRFTGPIDVARRAGWKGLYRGYGATLLREVPGSALMLASYASALGTLEAQGGMVQKTAPLLAGALGGAVYWSITYPVDFIKSKVQTDMSYRNARECALKVFEAEGVHGFFRGFTPCFLRSLPANGATFVAYEVVRAHLD